MSARKFYNRDISWLSFNYRVLQEAKNPDVPVIERLRFLAIYSSNLDEFYRVRIANLRRLIRLKGKKFVNLSKSAKKLVQRINKRVDKHRIEFWKIFKEQLIPKMAKEGIHLLDDSQLSKSQAVFVQDYFKKKVQRYLKPQKNAPFLENKGTYFTIRLAATNGNEEQNIIVNIPTNKVLPFLIIPDKRNHVVIQLSDVIRASLKLIFPGRSILHCYAVKLSRDAELHLGNEIASSMREKIMKSLHKRNNGIPSRFLYDSTMPKEYRKYLVKALKLEKRDLIPGGRYHNFNEFSNFPVPANSNLEYKPYSFLPNLSLDKTKSIFEAISKHDHMLHFPYQSYEYVIRLLKEASKDPDVKSIKITLYRVASDSKIAKALMKAAKNGIEIIVFNEIKARFDESSNIFWGNKIEAAGGKVIYSFEDLKVHSKILVITRKEGASLVRYLYLGTGNFNEKTARIYCDHGLFTKNQTLGKEIEKVFAYLNNPKMRPNFKHLLVAPFHMRRKFEALIDNEIDNAKKGNKASMVLKMNSLEDHKMIKKLYQASNAGVKITIIVRGICCLIPGVEGMSKKIKVYSIIDRFLEHGRIYLFHNQGKELIYLSSADWMKRNLSRRVEVAFPILDSVLKREVRQLINYQLKDNTKSRKLNKIQNNPYKKSKARKRVQAQLNTYLYLQEKNT